VTPAVHTAEPVQGNAAVSVHGIPLSAPLGALHEIKLQWKSSDFQLP